MIPASQARCCWDPKESFRCIITPRLFIYGAATFANQEASSARFHPERLLGAAADEVAVVFGHAKTADEEAVAEAALH